jgi:hypothetical protein
MVFPPFPGRGWESAQLSGIERGKEERSGNPKRYLKKNLRVSIPSVY